MPDSLINTVWSYSGAQTFSKWLFKDPPKPAESSSISSATGNNKGCCGHSNMVDDKLKGHCHGGNLARYYGRGGPTGCFVRLAGISGALAVGFGAYGAHVFNKKSVSEELKKVYETGNQYHLIHSLALLGVPLTRRPVITGSLFILGMILFCGSCYFHAMTEYKPIREVTPYGGMLLILGWISIVI